MSELRFSNGINNDGLLYVPYREVQEQVNEAYNQGAKELAEWLAEVSKVSEPIKEYTINRWLEDFAKWQEGAENV